ncbi:hypothetical protein [Vibrio sp. ABG19]|uniref:hypothetical protein n=1 Tax=Vibrio sp. ABG19 TaxID=2817385 RepID=UPI00249DA1FA|nr:hypothetical protein [Vibrio sp. ABG19]WGY46802.1 hypothetical protein J0X00_18620 [Vibrio sp. ABG19]
MGIVTLDANTQARLKVVTHFFRKMEQANIAYCHWKSNEHLQEGLLGITDLDVLVERGKTRQLNRALFDSGFKLFNAMATHGYPAVEDYLAVDASSGSMVHLHLHYQLICGEPHLKGYRLPWEHLILSERQYQETEHVFIVEPNMEMLLLIVRSVLKLRSRDRVLNALGQPYFRSERQREFAWLQQQLDVARLTDLTEHLLGHEAALHIASIVRSAAPSLKQILDFKRCVQAKLNPFRTYMPLHARWRRTVREFFWICGGINKHYIHAPVPLRRISASGGLLIVLSGCDGCGKSTQVKSVQKWLAWKIDVISLYFGSGQGSSSVLRWPLKMAAKLLRAASPERQLQSDPLAETNASLSHQNPSLTDMESNTQPYFTQTVPSSSRLKQIAKAIWALTLSLEKRQKLRQASRARNRGIVVLCDRYPQNQIMGFNDGPLLSHWLSHSSGMLRALARWEAQPYRTAEFYPPDLVIKLNISAPVAMERKSDMSFEQFKQRAAANLALNYPSPTRVINIDAEQPIEQVLLEIKNAIWREF